MMRHGLPEGAWRKSSYSPDNGPNCVEIQSTADGLIAVGDSNDRPLGAFAFRRASWQSFLDGVKDGWFNR